MATQSPPSTPSPLAEISQGPGAFEQFLDRNQKSLIVLTILVVLGAAAYVVYEGVEDGKQQAAGNALVKAEDLASLEAVVNSHSDTHAAKSAMLLLAEKQWSEGQKDNAIETLRKFVDANPSHPGIPSAKASLASKLMAQGKSGDATTIFQEIADDPKARFLAPFALISLGDIAKAGGDTAKAETYFKRINTDFAGSSFNQTAGKRIASLNAKAPVQIDPPPKPVEPPPAATSEIPEALRPGIPTSSETTVAPGGITITPVDPDAPATDTAPAFEVEPAPVVPPQETPQAPPAEPEPAPPGS